MWVLLFLSQPNPIDIHFIYWKTCSVTVVAAPYMVFLLSCSVTISSPGGTKFRGFQIGAHAVDGLWETLYGEFTSAPTGARVYKYFSDVEVSL